MIKKIFVTVFLVLIIASSAYANNLILIPTGTTLSTGQYRVEAVVNFDNSDNKIIHAAAGLKQLELNATHLGYEGGREENLLGAQWNFLPETFITPAIGFGVTDATSQTKEGFGVYAALTKSVPTTFVSRFVNKLSFTVGMGAKSINGLFGGFEAQLPLSLAAQVEYDGDNWNAALAWQPVKLFRFKVYSIKEKHYYGAELIPIEF